MEPATDHAETASLLAAHALGAVDRHEADAVARHVEVCRPCREELERLEAVVRCFGSRPASS